MDKYYLANATLSKFSRYYLELKKGLPIRPSEMGLLNILTGIPGPCTSVMLAERLDVSKPMITALLNSLSDKGYITKEQSADDKRVYFVLPTDKALELVARTKEDVKLQLCRLEDAMGQEGFDSFIRLTQIANAVLREGCSCERN